MRLRWGLRQCLARPLTKGPLNTSPLCPYFREAKRRGAHTSNHDEIDAVDEKVRPKPKALSAEALHAISLGSTAKLPRDHHPES